MIPRSSSWTDRLTTSAHIRFFLEVDWASSPLGLPETWNSSLRFAVNMVFADSRAACVYWGPDNIAVYNEAFMPMIAKAHPVLMGKAFVVGFPDLWTVCEPIFKGVEQSGMTVDVNPIELFTERNGYLEETYFIGQFIPLRGESGLVEGIYNTCYESTTQVLSDRKRTVINKLSSLPARSLSELFRSLIPAFELSPRDIPFSLIYSADTNEKSGDFKLELQGSIGVPEGSHCVPREASLGEDSDGFISLFREAKTTGSTIILRKSDGSLMKRIGHLLDCIKWQGFGEQCNTITISSLSSGSQLIGFLVVGVNPRRLWDETWDDFVKDLQQHIEAKCASAISADNALRREKALVRDLAVLDQRIRHMAKFASVGMVQLTIDGCILWANDEWYTLTGHPKENQVSWAWIDAYTEESQDTAKIQWGKLLKGENSSCDLELRRIFEPPEATSDGEVHHMWVTALGFPLIEDGELKFVMGTLTDVSHLKWAESTQQRSALHAGEAKRQQEEFIDVTSHEMRNPLSAMYQCASMISTSLDGLSKDSKQEDLIEALESNVDAANTILTCAAHQRRIIDDVLILSRLESMMLSITPVAVQPSAIVQQTLKMFGQELSSDGIEINVVRHSSFDDRQVDLVYCDPSRLTQIFINLISNAIKFTKTRPRRRITMTYGASLEAPSETDFSFDHTLYWSPTSKWKQDPTSGADWGKGEPLYLYFSVEDTGPGLEDEELKRLFQRFSQANSKTHIQYGGSGLGLYISRELAEKQGGRIGIASTPNVGTAFAFYIKTKRAPTTKSDLLNGEVVHAAILKEARPMALGRIRALSSENSSSKSKTAKQQSFHAENTRLSLLLVEDNLVNQKVLRKLLEKAGCEVQVANHGLEALEVMEKTSWGISNAAVAPFIPVDVILMDWEMPVMDGLACSKRIRAIEAEHGLGQHVPIIATTANVRNEQIQMALDAGVDDVLTKPFLVEELMEKMRLWAKKS